MSNLPAPDPSQHWSPLPPAAFGRPSRWPTFVTLAIALLGVAVGFVGWFRPAPHNNQPPPKPTYTDQQVASAKADVCAAFAKLERAVTVVNAVPNGSNANEQLASATGTRQVFDVFSRYLLAKLAEEPATPPDLATAVRNQANSLQDALIEYLDGFTKSDSEMQSVVKANTEAAVTIRRSCK
ncbi:MAG TPA: hypothetical protein VKI00_33200 [Mycobacterium sp.]|uniref:hypothetical protein n=1 Tax=Mycobacterium sp. TaxID=1785 RepID=UPI002BC6531E|nr:hypothetical protein [Mycobacterium sp.]HME80349.1 hypothetical protein [Mycobacterium sp.]